MNIETAINLIAKVSNKKILADEIQYSYSYGEPGYENPKSGIIFTNWNYVPRYIMAGLDRRGFALEWEDEWIFSDKGKPYRSIPDRYNWLPSYYIDDDGSILGNEDINISKYADEIINNYNKADFFNKDFSEIGFTKSSDDFEIGFHPGQTDNPKEIYKKFKNDYDIIFQVVSRGQFDVNYIIWLRRKT